MWETVKLGEVCELAYGKALDKSERLDSDGVPAFGANGIKTFAKKSLFDEPSIIVGRKGSAGEITKVNEPFWALDVTYYIKIDRDIIDLNFLFYSLTILNLPSMARGVKPGINRNDVYEKRILLPPLAEQQRIVAKLDAEFAEIDSAIEVANAKEAEVQKLEGSLLSSSLGGNAMMSEIVKLGDVCDLQNGFAFKSSDYVDNSNTLNIRMSNIRPNGKFDEFHNIKFLPDNYATKYAEYKLIEGDLIIAMTDMAGNPKILGMPTIVKNLDGRAFLLNQRVGKLHKFSDEIFVPYLCHFLSTLKNFYKNKGAGGLQINISKKDILSAKIRLPPLAEQQRIVAKLDAAFAEIENANNSIIKSKANYLALKTSILAQELQSEAA